MTADAATASPPLDASKTVRQNGFVVQPYHPYTKESKLAVTPGQPMEVYAEIFPTAALFAPGHTPMAS